MMKNTFVKALATVLVILTLVSSISLVGMALEPIEAEQDTVAAMMDNAYCFKKPDAGTDTDVDLGTDTDVDFGTDTDVDFGTSTDADADIPDTDSDEKPGFCARFWRFVRNLFTFKWLF